VAQADGAVDLSGFWHGLFHYPSGQPPVAFTAELHDADGALLGSTSETGQVGEAAGRTITATLQGRRSGSATIWLKIYDGDFRQYDSVRYEGSISADGQEIEGRWTVQSHWSGTFLMIRAAGVGEEARTIVYAPAG
jgi:hypothetical protein